MNLRMASHTYSHRQRKDLPTNMYKRMNSRILMYINHMNLRIYILEIINHMNFRNSLYIQYIHALPHNIILAIDDLVYMCVGIYKYTYIHINICTYIYIHKYMYIHICI